MVYFRQATMLRLPLIVASLVALALPVGATPASVIGFDRPSALPNERVKVTSALDVPLRLYLVRRDVARRVASRLDRRLSFIGVVKANRSLRFSMPPLDAGTYRLATWDGRKLRTTGARLRLRSTPGCPTTRPNGSQPARQPRGVTWHGNGLLWAGLESDGVYSVPRTRVAADGSIFNKLPWVTSPPTATPSISGERIDVPAPPLRVRSVNLGSFSGDVDPSYMSAVDFPTPGCWRLTARVGDVSLVYVVQVEVED